ncbi:MAG: phosphoglucosamine mutase [Bacteroidales bacterium]|nr:phosphoglucosamine mutase [Bacteroidales bacterium]MBR6161736.1 phosphoglucosamine mutase [Bacteroidales bacterium]
MTLIKSISGIRGTIGGHAGENLTPIDIIELTSAFAVFLQDSAPDKRLTVVVGRDARISGDMVSRLVCGTLQGMGVDVIDTGLSTTPTTEMAVLHHHADGGVIVTASHNPMQWNALKLLNAKGEFISGEEGLRLQSVASRHEFAYADVKKLGTYSVYENAIQDHIDAILQLPLVDKDAIAKANFSIILDAVNSTGAISIPPLLRALGVKNITILNGEPNGLFAHNPEPIPEHLYGISDEMKRGRYDLGIVVDPDVDRLAFIKPDGEMFGEEYTLVAVADYVLQHQLGNTVSNLSSSRALRDVSRQYGVTYTPSAVGEVNVVEQMKATQAIIGGEGNGGVIYPELHYGRDALVGTALFLSYMARSGKNCIEIRSLYPEYTISKNKIELKDDIDIPKLLDSIAEKYASYDVNRADGVKIDFEDCWVHVRSSNTEPILRIYAEALTENIADNIAKKIMLDIREMIQ